MTLPEFTLNLFVWNISHPLNQCSVPVGVNGLLINPLTPNDHYSGPTGPLTSKRFILYIYSTYTGTEYFKHGIRCLFFLFKIFGSCIIHILCTGCAKYLNLTYQT